MWIQWLTFVLSAVGIVLAGVRLAPYGEALGRRMGIGQGWIGLIFLATLTSIPEMTTTITGASIGAPNIALGNAFGSNLFNVVIIAIMDVVLLIRRKPPFLSHVHPYHTISGGLAILLTTLGILGIVLKPSWSLGGISPISLLILIGYAVGVFLLFRAERQIETADEPAEKTMSLARAVIGFVLCGAIIVVSGFFLIHASKTITVSSGLSASFMGAVLVAIVTSLPELATSFGALRIGAHDMIIANLFGSNMFNILTIFFADLAFRGGPITSALGAGEADQIVVASCGILLTTIALVAIAIKPRRRTLGIGADTAILLIAYLGATAIIIGRGI